MRIHGLKCWLLCALGAVLAATTSAQAAVTFRAATQASSANGSTITYVGPGGAAQQPSGNVVPGLPAGLVGDFLLCLVESRDNVAHAMTGWTPLSAGTNGPTHSASLFWRIATGGDPTTVTHPGGARIIARIMRFRGVDILNPVDVINSFTSSGADLTTEASAITTVSPNTMLVFTAHMGGDYSGISITTPGGGGGFNFDFLNSSGGAPATRASIAAFYRLPPTTIGAQGPIQATRTGGAAAVSHGALIALRASGSLTINVPAGTTANDVMIAGITYRPCSNTSGGACTTTIVPPAGWTLVRATDQTTGDGTGGFGNHLLSYQRVASAAEPASYTWFFGGTPTHTGAAGGILSFSGVDTVGPIVAEGGQTTGYSYSQTAPSISTGTVTNTMLVSTHTINSSGTWTPPGGMTEAADIASRTVPDALGLAIEMNWQAWAPAGATGVRTATLSNPPVNDTGASHLLALRPSGVDHFAVDIGAASASTCSPKNVTITAQDISNATVTSYTGTIVLSTSTGHGDWAIVTANGTLTNGAADDGAASYAYAAADAGVITLALSNAHADDLTVSVVDPTVPTSLSTSAVINFRDNAFVITNDPIQVAGRNQAMSAAMWRRDLSTGNCAVEAGYAGVKNLDAWIIRDVSDPGGAAPTIGALVLPSAAPPVNPASNNLALTFTGGSASFNLSTTDVGKYALNLRDDTRLYATGVDILGVSGTITTRPFSLHINIPGNPGINTPAGAVFTSAGTNFGTTVRGVLWQVGDDANNDGVPDSGANLVDNGVAPSYAWLTALSATTPFTPATPSDSPPGTAAAGTLNNGSFAQASFSGGSSTKGDLQYTQVGSFTIQASATNYLNSAGVNLLGNGGVVGRFRPAYFDVIVTHGCTGGATFTYSGQPFAVTVTAFNALGGITTNYHSAFGFAKNTTMSNAGDVSNFTNNVLSGASDFTSGVGSLNTITYTFPVKETAPTTLTLRAIDTDTVSSVGHIEQTTEARSGRVVIQNAYGSELVDLAMPMKAQYYFSTAAGFVTNTADTCTAVTLSFPTFYGNLSLGETCVHDDASLSGQACTAPSGGASQQFREASVVTLGDFNLHLRAPGAGNDGGVDVSTNPPGALPSWLLFDWDGNGVHDNHPIGRATFGIYKGNPRHIYLRERY